MTKLQIFYYLSEVMLLVIWIVFFTIVSSSIWVGIGMGILATVLAEFRTRILDKIKVNK